MNETRPSSREVLDHIAAGGTLGELAGLGAADYEEIYATGYELYQAARYDDAAAVFCYLATHNHKERGYHFAYASALQMQGKWHDALHMYGLACSLDPAEPAAYIHIAECLRALGRQAEARATLLTVIALCEGRPEHQELRTRANAVHALVATEGQPPVKEKQECRTPTTA